MSYILFKYIFYLYQLLFLQTRKCHICNLILELSWLLTILMTAWFSNGNRVCITNSTPQIQTPNQVFCLLCCFFLGRMTTNVNQMLIRLHQDVHKYLGRMYSVLKFCTRVCVCVSLNWIGIDDWFRLLQRYQNITTEGRKDKWNMGKLTLVLLLTKIVEWVTNTYIWNLAYQLTKESKKSN